MLRALLKYSFLILSILSALLLSLSRFIPNINPYEQSIIGILGLITPFLVAVNVVFILFWTLTKKWKFISIPIIAIIIAWPVVNVLLGGHFFCKQDKAKGEKRFTLLSYNVRLLDLYNWSGKKNTRDEMISYLKNKNADILCLQEFYTGNDSVGINNIKSIQKECNYEYVAECTMNENKRGKWGSVIFSHAPIVQATNHDIDVVGSNLLQQVDLLFQADTISVFNVHLKSNKFSKEENDLVNSENLPSINNDAIEKTKKIYKKLERSSINRGLEASLVSHIIKTAKHPKVVCGDLNDIPSSYVYFKVRSGMDDAFLKKGKGLGATYNQFLSVLRIDYIFNSPNLKVNAIEIGKETYSDHFPMMAYFDLQKEG